MIRYPHQISLRELLNELGEIIAERDDAIREQGKLEEQLRDKTDSYRMLQNRMKDLEQKEKPPGPESPGG